MLWEICCRRIRSPHLLPHPWATYFNFSLGIIKLKVVWSQNKNSQQGCALRVKLEGVLDVVVPMSKTSNPMQLAKDFGSPLLVGFY
jgi:hypothetical protein